MDASGSHSRLDCEWSTGTDGGDVIALDVTQTAPGGVTAEVLESLGQTPIDDARFEEVGVLPAVVLGCEEGNAGGIVGCALTVYGQGTDITLQVLGVEAVTKEQMVEALWTVTEEVYA